MALVVSPAVLNAQFPVVRVCVTAVYPTNCKPQTCVKSPVLCIPQHDTRRIDIAFVNSDRIPYTVQDATEITFIISKTVRSNPLITKLKSNDGILVVNANAFINLTSAETGDLGFGSFYYECRVMGSNGNATTVLSGSLRVQDTRIGDS